ncbi:MAG: hypothetical protein ABR577_04310 [Pyrinomonadaceae bacterium]
MKRNQSLERRSREASSMEIGSTIGAAALIAVAGLVIMSIPDIKRYI